MLCCGLSCLDVELQSCGVPASRESVVEFNGTRTTAGGSGPQTARSLSRLGERVALSTAVGDDAAGRQLISLAACGGEVQVNAAVTGSPTAVAYLPLFRDGTRACFVDLGANIVADATVLIPDDKLANLAGLRVFHFGYPHLMPRLQGEALRGLFDRVRATAPHVRVTLDVNGASESENAWPVLAAALPVVAAVHANLDEACVISGLFPAETASGLPANDIRSVVQWFTAAGAGSAFITCGRNGAFASTGNAQAIEGTRLSKAVTPDAFVYRPAFSVEKGTVVNASGAGDAFTAGVVAALAVPERSSLVRMADAGLAAAWRQVNPVLAGEKTIGLAELLELAAGRPRIRPDECMQVAHLADASLRFEE